MDPSRISLRPFKLSDVDDFLKWISDERVTNSMGWDVIGSRQEALARLEKVVLTQPWQHSICLDDRSIGDITVLPGPGYEKCRAITGYAVGMKYWGQGIATIALKMALSRAFKDIPELVRLEAYTLEDNKKSQRVLEKAGFLREGLLRKMLKFDGEFRDCYVFSFLSTDKIL